MINNRKTLHGGQGSSRCLGAVSGFLLKLIRESGGLTQVQLAEKLCVDVASVQGWESGRRPLAALRTVDLVRLRYQLLRDGAEPTLLAMLEDAIRADLIIAETVQGGGQLSKTDGHPLGATVHQRQLTNLITWPFTGMTPAPIRDLVAARVRRGPVPDQPALTREEQTRFFDNLLVTADANLQHALTTDRLEQANLNYWAYWVGEIGQVQVDDEFMGCVDPREWSGVRLLGHLLTRLHPGSGHTELNIHTVWALLLTHPLLLNNHADLGSAVANTVDDLAADPDKLECLIQAIEYQDAGYTRVQGWIDSSRNSLRTNTALRIADAALYTSPLAWRGR